MFTPKVITAVPGKVNRSGFHRLVIPGLHGKRTAETERDIFGTLVVIILAAAAVFLMRIILAN